MTIYELRLTPIFPVLPGYGVQVLDSQAIEDAVPGAGVRSVVPAADGYKVAVELERGDHAQTMEELEAAFGQLGFTTAQAAITEFATSWLEGAALGAAGGAALGAATESAEAFALFFLGGLIVGAVAGGMRNEVNARFSATRAYPRGWRVAQIDQPRMSPSPRTV